MSYASLESLLLDLEKQGQLKRITTEVDPYLEVSAIQLENYQRGGPVLLFENVKGSRYRTVANLFGSQARTEWMFRSTLEPVQQLIRLRNQPLEAFKTPWKSLKLVSHALNARPQRVSVSHFNEISIHELPQIQHWPMDGGAFITLPQVYSEDPECLGIAHSNLGMYRIQLSGNAYVSDCEIGLHYQLHRGIGIHQTKARQRQEPLKVSVFIGGPPAHTIAAVMPLPEGMSEINFAGVLGQRRFRYTYLDGFCVSADADFVITGTVASEDVKPEGPFGDHLGYYSLQHPFPVMKVHKVYAKPRAIWPFTVVGRPPQEDTSFGNFIHHLTGSAISQEIPGVREVHAVDAAGVHPLLLAVGSERYTPYLNSTRPAELLTQANRILGTGQLSLAKQLFIAAPDESLANRTLNCKNPAEFIQQVWERMDPNRDFHFYTQTSIDTLDYSGDGLNSGSKLVIAANGPKMRKLRSDLPLTLQNNSLFTEQHMIFSGVAMLRYEGTNFNEVLEWLNKHASEWSGLAQLVIYNEHDVNLKELLRDYLWLTYTRTNPSHDIYGIHEKVVNKHWSCDLPVIYDARKKSHHAPVLDMPQEVRKKAQKILQGIENQ